VNVRIGIYWLTAPEAVLKGGSDCERNYLEVRVCFHWLLLRGSGVLSPLGHSRFPSKFSRLPTNNFYCRCMRRATSLHVQGGCGAGCLDAERRRMRSSLTRMENHLESISPGLPGEASDGSRVTGKAVANVPSAGCGFDSVAAGEHCGARGQRRAFARHEHSANQYKGGKAPSVGMRCCSCRTGSARGVFGGLPFLRAEIIQPGRLKIED